MGTVEKTVQLPTISLNQSLNISVRACEHFPEGTEATILSNIYIATFKFTS